MIQLGPRSCSDTGSAWATQMLMPENVGTVAYRRIHPPTSTCMSGYVYIYKYNYLYIYICIYIYREREIEICVCVCDGMYVHFNLRLWP